MKFIQKKLKKANKLSKKSAFLEKVIQYSE